MYNLLMLLLCVHYFYLPNIFHHLRQCLGIYHREFETSISIEMAEEKDKDHKKAAENNKEQKFLQMYNKVCYSCTLSLSLYFLYNPLYSHS